MVGVAREASKCGTEEVEKSFSIRIKVQNVSELVVLDCDAGA
jgi:hypothetical protein